MASRTLKTVLNNDTMEDITLSGNLHAAGHTAYYAEMTTIDNATATTINAQDQWHSVENDVVTGLVHGFTYADGSTGVIASAADGGGGLVLFTDVAHGLSVGDIITQNGTTNYNGIFKVMTVPSVDTYTVTVAWGVNESGYWQQGASLTCDVGSAGVYRGTWAACGISATNNEIFDFAPCLNTTIATKAKARRKFSSADYGSFSGVALMTIAEGDIIHFSVMNSTGTGNLTIRTRDLNLVKI